MTEHNLPYHPYASLANAQRSLVKVAAVYAIRWSSSIRSVRAGPWSEWITTVFIRAYDGDELLRESLFKSTCEKRITIELRVDHVKADPDEPTRRVYGVVRDAQGDLLRG